MTTSSAVIPVSTTRILKLIDYLVASGLATTKREAFEMIGFNYHNANKLRNGVSRFTSAQIEAICKITGANANWIFGFEEAMMRKSGKTPIDQLKDAVAAVEHSLSTK